MTKTMQVAVIGAGPAAFGTISRLVQYKKDGFDIDIHVFSTGQVDQEAQICAQYQESYDAEQINHILKSARTPESKGILPPRSFLQQPVRAHVGKDNLKTGIKVSNSFGGIGNYWSSSVLPVHSIHDELGEMLGVERSHYQFIADRLKISGAKGDSLAHFFEDESVNCPPISIGEGFSKLKGRWDKVDGTSLDLAFGVNRFAINTDHQDKNGCIQCGDCMYGCPRDAMFRAAKPIADFAADGLCHIHFEQVTRVKSEDNHVQVRAQAASKTFDKVFVCAGALGSASLLGQSYGAPSKPLELFDNLLWYFPLVSLMGKSVRTNDLRIAFAEIAGGLFDHNDSSYNHLLISSLPDAVLDNIMGRNRFSQNLTRLLSRHLLIGAMYGSRDEYIRYSLSPVEGGWKAIDRKKSVESISEAKFKFFKQNLAEKGWHTHISLVKENETSGHYSANLGTAYDIVNLAQHGRFDENLYICDSSSWNGASMSQQHTFTIMANAVRLIQSVFS